MTDRKQMGRPTKPARPGTQVTIGLRVPAELKTRLETAAASEHRTLSQESERRLERSFKPDALFLDALNALGPHSLNPLGAGSQVRTMLQAVYGPDVSDVGQLLMNNLVLLRFSGSGKVKVRKADLERVKAAIREIEKAADLTHGKE